MPPSQPTASSSTRPSPPNGTENNGELGSSETGTSTPVNGKDGNIYFECTNCSRSIASNRYAPHLSSCLGLGGTRRAAPRNATTKSKLASEAGRSASPYMVSELGHLSDDGKATNKAKGKSKAKRSDEAEFSLNRKRNGSPSISPAKKSKKQKTSGEVFRPYVPKEEVTEGSGIASTSKGKSDDIPLSNNLLPLGPSHSHSKLPSKLREMSTASSKRKDKRSSSPDSNSRFSSPHSGSTPNSSFSTRSPTIQAALPGGKAAAKPKKKLGRPPLNGTPAPPVKRPSPPRPPPPPPPPVKRMPEPDYLVDHLDGDETGSSTDSD
ncbi:hypothetical protein NLI96_g8477 [Meripilus lineatus]|uniref:SAGA-associated factor 11 n=1 Tax=Meripilus lineatus TaxID=2056292 RepID=A0AAD5V1X3_9APHY|nr:hypothetical protein NLI96_g8477 [Physisporinus lineatus]